MKKIGIGLILFSLILLSGKGVQALIIPQMTMEEMVARANTIVIGTGEHFHFHPDPEGKALYAFIRFRVKEYLKNDLGEEEIVIMQIAQEKGEDGSYDSGPFALKMDEEVVLFLTEEDNEGFRHVFGLSQGKFSVVEGRRGEKNLVQEMKGIRLFNKETGEISEAKDKIRIKMTYDEFRNFVRRTVSTIEARKKALAAIPPNTSY